MVPKIGVEIVGEPRVGRTVALPEHCRVTWFGKVEIPLGYLGLSAPSNKCFRIVEAHSSGYVLAVYTHDQMMFLFEGRWA